MSYDNPMSQSVSVTAATISAAAALFTFSGPVGKRGRVVALGASITTTTTTAATELRVGTTADPDDFATLSVPVGVAGLSYQAAAATLFNDDDNLIPADAELIIATDGGADAGAADIHLMVEWFD